MTEIVAGVAANILGSGLGVTARRVESRLKELAEHPKDDAHAATTYLEVAAACLAALESESDELLLAALHLPWEPDEEQRQKKAAELLQRIDAVTIGEMLRPQLATSLAKLEACAESLQKESRRLFGALKPRPDRARVLDDLTEELTSLHRELTGLAEIGGIQGRGSAYGKGDLLDIRARLAGGEITDAADFADQALRGGSSPDVLDRNRRIGKLTEQLRISFR